MNKISRSKAFNYLKNANNIYRMFINNNTYNKFLNDTIQYHQETILQALQAKKNVIEKHTTYIRYGNGRLDADSIKDAFFKTLDNNIIVLLIVFKTSCRAVYFIN